MIRFEQYLKQMAAKESKEIPVSVKKRIEAELSALPEKVLPFKRSRWYIRVAVVGICMAAVMLFLLPNISPSYAKAMEQIPVLSNIVKVLTIRDYFYSSENYEMSIKIPGVFTETGGEAVDRINDEINSLTSELVNKFYKEVELVGEDGHGSIYMDYDIITNTEKWFTLKLSVGTVVGSSGEYFKYYHVDRRSGEYIELGDLFIGEEYKQILKEEIMIQMRQQMESDSKLIYYLDAESFTEIKDTHNFYLNHKGNLVIPFDKYEVGAGYMGCPEFVIPKEVVDNILKSKFSSIIK